MKCSCPPFECMCNDMLGQPQNLQPTCYESNMWDSGTSQNAYNPPSQSEDLYHPCEFPRDLAPIGDVFQPDEIFQLDQPIRPETELSPERTLLDLNSSSTGSFSTSSDFLFSCEVERASSFPHDLLALPEDVKPFPPSSGEFYPSDGPFQECTTLQRFYPSKTVSDPLYFMETIQPLDSDGYFQQSQLYNPHFPQM